MPPGDRPPLTKLGCAPPAFNRYVIGHTALTCNSEGPAVLMPVKGPWCRYAVDGRFLTGRRAQG